MLRRYYQIWPRMRTPYIRKGTVAVAVAVPDGERKRVIYSFEVQTIGLDGVED